MTKDGALRAAIALPGKRGWTRHGWMTLVLRDGAENATYLRPQPERAPTLGEERPGFQDPVPDGQAQGGVFFVF